MTDILHIDPDQKTPKFGRQERTGQKAERLVAVDELRRYTEAIENIRTLDKKALVSVHKNMRSRVYTDPEIFGLIAKSILNDIS